MLISGLIEFGIREKTISPKFERNINLNDVNTANSYSPNFLKLLICKLYFWLDIFTAFVFTDFCSNKQDKKYIALFGSISISRLAGFCYFMEKKPKTKTLEAIRLEIYKNGEWSVLPSWSPLARVQEDRKIGYTCQKKYISHPHNHSIFECRF